MGGAAIGMCARDAQTGATRRLFPLDNVSIRLVGGGAEWLEARPNGNTVIVRPMHPLPARCSIRPAALFVQDRGFPDVNMVMGRLLFSPGATEPQQYTPFTCDPRRQLRELLLAVETTPDDDLLASRTRWSNCEAISGRQLAAAKVPPGGLQARDIDELLQLEPWQQPLEGCVLHALAQWTHACGECVVEIGSLRGQSISMLAMGLRAAGSDAALVSIDPHLDQPHNHAQVRLTLRQIGEERRLVQLVHRSDEAARLLRPGVASLIFVDGDHSYRQVVADFENYRELLAPGGCMVFHDYGYGAHNGRPDVVPEVRPAIDENIMPAAGFRPLLLAHTLMVFVKE